MSENSIKSIMDVTMDKLRAMVDANTIIGDPIVVGDVTLLPVSKVSFGLATGGSDFPSKTQSGLFGGGGGAGVTIAPVAFIAVSDGNVKMMPVYNELSSAEKAFAMAPDVIERAKELFFLAAPYNLRDTVTPEQFRRAVYEMQECFHADYIFLDTPGDNGLPYSLASAAADAALVISTHQPASIRAAEKTAEQLQKSGITDRRLIINNFDFAAVRKGLLPGISEIIDRTTVPLLGVIPYDMQFGRLQEHGALFDSSPSLPASTAIRNITQRLLCPTVRLPLFTGFGSAERKTVRL